MPCKCGCGLMTTNSTGGKPREWADACPNQPPGLKRKRERDRLRQQRLRAMRTGYKTPHAPPPDAGDSYLGYLIRDPCAYCGKQGGTIDHIVPNVSGGENDDSNFTSACLSCNSSKQGRPLLKHLLLVQVDKDMAPFLEERSAIIG